MCVKVNVDVDVDVCIVYCVRCVARLSSPAAAAPTTTTGSSSALPTATTRRAMLQCIPVLSALSAIQMDIVMTLLREDDAKAGQYLVRAGDLVEEMVVIESGQAKQFYPVDGGGLDAAGQTSTLGPGSVFGQRSVMAQTSTVAKYSVVCEQPVHCLRYVVVRCNPLSSWCGEVVMW